MANRIHDAFDSIQADDQLKEKTKQYIQARSGKKPRFIYRTAFQGMLMFACMALFLVAGVGGYSWIYAPVSYVSIDVNPSIELALNRLDRVVSAAAFNKEGKKILDNLSLKGKRYTDAIHAIMDDDIMRIYLADDSELVFTVAADSGRDDRLKTGVEACSGHIGHGNSQSISVDLKIVQEAHDSGISLGKYYAWLQLMQYDDSITVDQCKNMSISKIHGLTKVHEQHESHNQDETHDLPEEHDGDQSGQDGYIGDSESDQYEEGPQDSGCGQNEDNIYDGWNAQDDTAQDDITQDKKTQDDGNEQDQGYWEDESSMDEYESSSHNSHHHAGHE